MLVEGPWWVNESQPTFASMSSFKGSGLNERNLAFMPLPKVSEAQVGEPVTLIDSINDLAFISSHIEEKKIPLAKKFLQYCETQESLVEFFTTTNTVRGYEVDFSGIYDSLGTFQKSIIDTVAYGNMCIAASGNEVFRKNYNVLQYEEQIGTLLYPDPIVGFEAGKTALEMFNSLSTKYNVDAWNILLTK